MGRRGSGGSDGLVQKVVVLDDADDPDEPPVLVEGKNAVDGVDDLAPEGLIDKEVADEGFLFPDAAHDLAGFVIEIVDFGDFLPDHVLGVEVVQFGLLAVVKGDDTGRVRDDDAVIQFGKNGQKIYFGKIQVAL